MRKSLAASLTLSLVLAVASVASAQGSGVIEPYSQRPIVVESQRPIIVENVHGPIDPFEHGSGAGGLTPKTIGGIIEPFEHSTVDPYNVHGPILPE